MSAMTNPQVTYRPATPDDTRAVFEVFATTIADLTRRTRPTDSYGDPEKMLATWERRRGLFDFLAQVAERWWVAEREGRVVGYARAIFEDGVRELTEFFVHPEVQSVGVGRELLSRVFSAEGARRRIVIATSDQRAQVRYLKGGVVPRSPICYFHAAPQSATIETDLVARRLTDGDDDLLALTMLDREVIGQSRAAVHVYFRQDREGWVYERAGRPVGYGYWTATRNGPIAMLADGDVLAVLAHGESLAAARGKDEFGVEVPLVNAAAVRYLLARGFQLDPFQASLMSDVPFGRLENYLVTSPPFFL
jgi:ribosomal protein S18 acetylase RimI-like enzyme